MNDFILLVYLNICLYLYLKTNYFSSPEVVQIAHPAVPIQMLLCLIKPMKSL